MQDRTPSATPIGIGLLKDYEFVCNKKSNDMAQEKATWFYLRTAKFGECSMKLRRMIWKSWTRYEGGYKRQNVTVFIDNEPVTAVTYISDKLTEEPPTRFYLQLIIDGAIEHQLPEDYIAKLKAIDTKN